jgi:branched-chain amino acid transport system ATP-binding protein
MTTAQHSLNGTAPEREPVTPALTVRDVAAGYDRTVVLDGVDLEVAAGGVTALLGPNGAGKTTLLRAITGLIAVGRGQVLLRGDDITNTPSHQRARLGLCHIPEGRGIYRTMTVKENLRMQVPAAGEAAAVDKAVSAFPILGRRLDQMAGTMSGGEQQMLALAAAYTRSPSMIVVDELSLGLAPVVVDQLFEFLARLVAEQGVSLLVVDQYAAKTLEIADRAYVMRKGQIVFEGAAKGLSVDELFERYLGDPA